MFWIYVQTVLPLAIITFIIWWTWPKRKDSDKSDDIDKQDDSKPGKQ
jgi:hypothetical protein